MQCGKGSSLSRNLKVRIRTTTTHIEYLLHVICQIWFDEMMTFTRHIDIFVFIFPGDQITGLFSNISISNSWQHIFMLTNLGPWFPLCINRNFESLYGFRYNCTKFHLTGEEMLEEGGVKSCPLNKGAITKDQFWMSLFYFSYSQVRNVPGRLPKTCLFRPSRFIRNAFLRKIIKKWNISSLRPTLLQL